MALSKRDQLLQTEIQEILKAADDLDWVNNAAAPNPLASGRASLNILQDNSWQFTIPDIGLGPICISSLSAYGSQKTAKEDATADLKLLLKDLHAKAIGSAQMEMDGP